MLRDPAEILVNYIAVTCKQSMLHGASHVLAEGSTAMNVDVIRNVVHKIDCLRMHVTVRRHWNSKEAHALLLRERCVLLPFKVRRIVDSAEATMNAIHDGEVDDDLSGMSS